MAMKNKLVSYGGPGYAHILDNVIPWMRGKGMTEKTIHTITVENPKRMLTFVSP
jgi:phosphotriesterase-related protein